MEFNMLSFLSFDQVSAIVYLPSTVAFKGIHTRQIFPRVVILGVYVTDQHEVGELEGKSNNVFNTVTERKHVVCMYVKCFELIKSTQVPLENEIEISMGFTWLKKEIKQKQTKKKRSKFTSNECRKSF